MLAPTGERYWGRFGAAGLLAVDARRGVLLQHRVAWSHFGGTWGLPGGALHEGESARDGALREAQEEAGIPDGAVRARFASVLDLTIWSYTTVIADVVHGFDPVISDPESLALEWVPIEEVEQRPLHPGFADAWPKLKPLLAVHPAVVVDAANVVGSVPDGWWKDRAGAAERLRARLTGWAANGVAAEEFGVELHRSYPQVSMVVEGEARAIADAGERQAGGGRGRGGGSHSDSDSSSSSSSSSHRDSNGSSDGAAERVRVIAAEGAGDDAIVAEARRLRAEGRPVVAVTSDRVLRDRLIALGARVESAGWLLGQLDR